MASTVYVMPPIPVKADLYRQLIMGPHRMELLLGAAGKPFLALIVSTDYPGIQENRLVQNALRLVTQEQPGNLTGGDFSLLYHPMASQSVFQLQADVQVDLARYEVQRGNQHIPLRAREAELLRILLRQPGRYVKAEVLAEAIGAEGVEAPEHPVEEMISNLRRKLGETPYHPKLIRCKRLAGYAIFPEESES